MDPQANIPQKKRGGRPYKANFREKRGARTQRTKTSGLLHVVESNEEPPLPSNRTLDGDPLNIDEDLGSPGAHAVSDTGVRDDYAVPPTTRTLGEEQPDMEPAIVVPTAEAVTVEEPVFAESVSLDESRRKKRRKCLLVAAAVILVAVAAFVGGGIAFTGDNPKDDVVDRAKTVNASSSSFSPTSSPTSSSPSTNIPTLVPSPGPSPTPTSSPTPTPTSSPSAQPSNSPTVPPTPGPTEKVWEQVGNDLLGPAVDDSLGGSVAISRSGDSFVAGAVYHDFNGQWSGLVQVFDVSKGGEVNASDRSWQRRGPNIYGVGEKEFAGYSVAIAGDAGNIIAYGAPDHDKNGERVGMVRAYHLSSSSSFLDPHGWEEYGESVNDNFGRSVSLSSTGRFMAVGAPSSSFQKPGFVEIFELDYKFNQWFRLGNKIEGDENFDFFGNSVSLSGDGRRVAIGSKLCNSEGRSDSGKVRIYDHNATWNSWDQIGGDLNGDSALDEFGTSVSLSADGSRVAVGADNHSGGGIDHSGLVRVFQYVESTEQWEQVGEDIFGEDVYDLFGTSVSLSGNGSIVAAGAIWHNDTGRVRVFEFVRGDEEMDPSGFWRQLGQSFDGDEKNDDFGQSVSLSGDGHRLAIGATGANGESGGNTGLVRVFERRT